VGVEERQLPLRLLEGLRAGQLAFAHGAAVAPQVDHLETAAAGNAADQPPAVARAGVFFAAEQDGAEAGGPGEQIRERFLEWRPLRQAIVENVALRVVELRVFRPAAENMAKKLVREAFGAEVAGENLPVELDGVAGIGARTHVDDKPDRKTVEQFEEGLQRVVRMADRVERPA